MEIKYYKCDICSEKFDTPIYSNQYTDKNVLLSVTVRIGGVSDGFHSSEKVCKHICMNCLKKLGIKFDIHEDKSHTTPESFEDQFVKLLEIINIYPQE